MLVILIQSYLARVLPLSIRICFKTFLYLICDLVVRYLSTHAILHNEKNPRLCQ